MMREGEADGVDGGGVEGYWPATERMPSVPKSFFMSCCSPLYLCCW